MRSGRDGYRMFTTRNGGWHNMGLTVFAIDPGPTESAYAYWDGSMVQDFGKVPNDKILSLIEEQQNEKIQTYIEMIASYGMAVGKEVFETCVWIGRFSERANMCDQTANLVYRKAVKMHLCGSMKAKDANIIQALKDRFGDKGTKASPGVFYGVSGDVWQAIALAVTVWDGAA